VAVKLLRPEYAGNGEMLARFRAEARYAALVCHPGVVPVYDYGPVGPVGAPFLVMELVDGPSLAEVAACGPLEPAWVLDMAGQLAAGLAAAHAQGLVHRDIKPANLLLAPGGTVKITDFGIASAAGSASLTLAGTLPGTPGYLAPERAAGAPATAASDLYSLGVVAWECLAGAPPFTGTPLEITLAHADRVMPPLPAAIPRGVADLVAELTAKDPAARPASAASVAARADQLRAAITGTATITTDRPAAGLPGPLPPTLAGVTVHHTPRLGRLRPRRLAALAVAMLLAAWLTAEMSGAASRTQSAAQHRRCLASRPPGWSWSATPPWRVSQPALCSGSCAGPACSLAWYGYQTGTWRPARSSRCGRPARYWSAAPSP
jgi:eukaryotic-like serine/threonine-protein kinase